MVANSLGRVQRKALASISVMLFIVSVAQAQIIDLGTLGGTWSEAVDVSADGSTIVGYGPNMSNQARAFRWTASCGMQDLGTLGGTYSTAVAVSADGLAVVGFSANSSGKDRAFFWSAGTGMLDIGTLGSSSYARAVSSDGSTVVGYSYKDGGMRAFRWTFAGGMQDLGSFGGPTSDAIDVSSDGTIVVGTSSWFGGQSRAFRWTANGGMQDLGDLGFGGSFSSDVSADGSTVVGHSYNSEGQARPFRWTTESGMQDLGSFGGPMSVALATSADGSVVVGASQDSAESYRAFRWTAATGIAEICDEFSYSTSVSADGSTVVGYYANSSESGTFRWTLFDGLVHLPTLAVPLGVDHSVVSADGLTIAGTSFNASNQERAFTFGRDRDGDGLFDDWEENGIDVDGDGNPEIDLKQMGANPDRKDIFVEVDSMSGYAPSAQAMQMVKNAFAAAPVHGSKDEPDKQGINLHIYRDGDDELPVSSFVRTDNSTNGGAFKPIADYLAQQNCIGPPSLRSNPLWQPKIRQAWLRVFRYCLFAKEYYNGNWRTGGMANGIGGNFFFVTLGSDFWTNKLSSSFYARNRDNSVAGVFMHELGHTLGLRHGGGDNISNKPNYASLLNYVWTIPFENFESGWKLDYSRRAFNTLNENSLDENTGIGGRIGVRVPISTWLGTQLANESGPVNFNWNLFSGQTNVAADINGDGKYTALTTQEDWPKLVYRAYGAGWEQDPSYVSLQEPVPCQDSEQIAASPLGTASGRIHLQDYVGSTSGEPLTITVWKNGVAVETLASIVGDNNIYAVSPVTTGAVNLKFQLLTGLTKAVDTTLGSSPVLDLNVTLTNGDCNGDDYVGTDDYLILSEAFDASIGDADFSNGADLNGDGYVGTDDYLILNNSFDTFGD